MSVLALDVATCVGWAFGGAGDPPASGTFRCPSTGDDSGRFLVGYAQWLTAKLRELGPKEVVFEAPILPRETNITTLRKLYSLAGITEFVCVLEGVSCTEITAGEWRRSFLGPYYPKGGRRDELKMAVIAACRALGWNPVDDNEGDALAILHVVLSVRNPRYAAASAVAAMEAR